MKNSGHGKIIKLCAGAFISCLLWGSAFPSIKTGYALFEIASSDTASQILFAGIRFTLAGILTILMGSLVSRRFLLPRRSSAGMIFRLSCFQTTGQYIFFYIGLAHTSGVNASVINGSAAIMAILIAALVFRSEKLNVKKAAGMAAGFAGVILISVTGGSASGDAHLVGDICILISTVCYGISTVFIKEYSQYENVAVLSGYQFLTGGLVMCLAGLVTGGRLTVISLPGAGLIIYLAFVSAAAYTIWGILLSKNPVSRVAVFGFMTPILGVILSSLILHENGANKATALSLVLICISIVLVNLGEKQKE